jgi:peptidoglycan/xylan/chitin deacetylase (PgdA/CDA1 family)
MGKVPFKYSPIISRKPIKWPGDARIAVWFIPNIEDYNIDVPSPGISPVLVPLMPDVLNWGWKDYGTRVGVWRLMDLFDRHGIKATVALNASVCQDYPIIIEEGKKRGWEFMGHGITNSKMITNLAVEEERAIIRTTIETIAAAAGKRPEGWLGPGLAETYNTVDILAEQGIRYVCDWCNDDEPYPMEPLQGRLISMPYSLEINDFPAIVHLHRTAGEFYEMIKDQFDVLYEEGQKSGKVMAVALHPMIMGSPSRIKYLDGAIKYIKQHKAVWFATGSEIANWYYEHYL